MGLPGASPRCRARFLKPHKMVAQEQGSRASVALWMAGMNSDRCFGGGRLRVRLAGDEPASAVWRVYLYFSQGRQRWTNRDLFSRSSGNGLPNVSMATQHSGHSLAGVMHLRQRSTTTELMPLLLSRPPSRLASSPPPSHHGQAIRLDLVLHASGRVLSPWPRGLVRKTRRFAA